jgi:uncharacterized protein YkwD
MGYSFCLNCRCLDPDTPGYDPPTARAVDSLRATPAIIFATGLFLLMVVAAILIQVCLLHSSPAPVPVNASTPPSPPVIPAITGTTAIAATLSSRDGEVPAFSTTSLEALVHERVNRVRQEYGLPILGMDGALASIARAHSADMASHGYFGHVNLDEMDPTARGAAAGYACHKDRDRYFTYAIAENLFATYRYDTVLVANSREMKSGWLNEEAIADMTVDAWMNSPEHRNNILEKGMGEEGIGVAVAKNDLVFVTEDFC